MINPCYVDKVDYDIFGTAADSSHVTVLCGIIVMDTDL